MVMNRNKIFKKKSIIFFSILFVTFLCWQYSQTRKTVLQFFDHEGTKHVLKISVKDRNRLHYLMHELFAQDSFAYTCLGYKPMSWAYYKKPFTFHNWSIFYKSLSKYNRRMHLG